MCKLGKKKIHYAIVMIIVVVVILYVNNLMAPRVLDTQIPENLRYRSLTNPLSLAYY